MSLIDFMYRYLIVTFELAPVENVGTISCCYISKYTIFIIFFYRYSDNTIATLEMLDYDDKIDLDLIVTLIRHIVLNEPVSLTCLVCAADLCMKLYCLMTFFSSFDFLKDWYTYRQGSDLSKRRFQYQINVNKRREVQWTPGYSRADVQRLISGNETDPGSRFVLMRDRADALLIHVYSLFSPSNSNFRNFMFASFQCRQQTLCNQSIISFYFSEHIKA